MNLTLVQRGGLYNLIDRAGKDCSQAAAPAASSARPAGLTGRAAVSALNPEERARRAERAQRFAALQGNAATPPVQVGLCDASMVQIQEQSFEMLLPETLPLA